jgi:hypothetical protein
VLLELGRLTYIRDRIFFQKRQDLKHPTQSLTQGTIGWPDPFCRVWLARGIAKIVLYVGTGRSPPRGELLVRVVEVLERNADVFEVVLALCATGSLAGRLDRGQEQRDQDADNRNHHEQLYERECKSAACATWRHGTNSVIGFAVRNRV